MNLRYVTAMRLRCYDKAPREQMEGHWPKEVLHYAWIPQTLGDQVWVAFEFASAEAKREYEESLPDDLRGAIDPNLIGLVAPYGWATLDANGFPA